MNDPERMNDPRCRSSRHRLAWLSVLLVTAAAACSDDNPNANQGSDAVTGSGLDGAGTLDFQSGSDGFDIAQEDVPPEPGTFHAPCTGNDECDSGLCIESADGKICTQTCIEDCPAGFGCVQKQAPGGDVIYLCAPRFLYICDPCKANVDCNDSGDSGNVCLGFGDAGNFCGVKCSEIDPECPAGYSCQAMEDGKSGLQSHQCVREGGALCECSVRAVSLALDTTCTNANFYGACSGVRQCGAHGLTECLGPNPRPEECNGVDDDCNGATDDFAPNASCKSPINEFGQCKGKLVACENGKPVCDAQEAKPELCNGIDDDCDGDTDEGLCEDGLDCTKGICNTDGSCKQIQLSGTPCDDGSICTAIDKCANGLCIGGGALDCDDKDACSVDSCDPLSGCMHAPASEGFCADDGNPCTQDLCQNGACVHPPVQEGLACADDGKACTTDVCSNGFCTHLPADGKACVEDGNPCTSDVCKGGLCSHVASDGGICTDDGIDCTTDVCQGGLCKHPAASGAACEDGNPCTDMDSCLAGSCKSGPFKSCDASNPCTKDLCDPLFGCRHSNNDWALCTAPNADCPTGVCQGGTCMSKPNEPCETEVKIDLCGSQPVQGLCTASGKCTPVKANNGIECSIPCNGICFKCFGLQVCFPLTG